MKNFIASLFLHYLRLLAKIQLAKINFLQKIKGKKLTIVGITGSAGKSSTVNACQAILKSHFLVTTSAGSNSESGIPLNILGIKIATYSIINWIKIALIAPIKLLTNWQSFDIYIAEMGVDAPNAPKNMSYLLKILKPHIGVFLNAGLAHTANFSDFNDPLLRLAQEKAKLINSLNKNNFAIINSLDPLVTKTTSFSTAQKLSIGKSSQNTIKLISSSPTSGFQMDFQYHNKIYQLQFNQLILPSVYQISFASAICVGLSQNLSITDIIANLQNNFVLPPGRSSLFSGINHSKIIDSSYNSSPIAISSYLSLLDSFKNNYKIAIIGDMRELGQSSLSSHQQIYNLALKHTDLIISVGPETKKYFGNKTQKFDFWWQALSFLKLHLKPKSIILVKGSQNTIYLEELVKNILKNKSDQKLLCRQSPYWLKVKKTFRIQHSPIE